MSPPEAPLPETQADAAPLSLEIRYSLPALLQEVRRDRASAAFAMEKLDQVAINLLFEQQRSPRDADSDK